MTFHDILLEPELLDKPASIILKTFVNQNFFYMISKRNTDVFSGFIGILKLRNPVIKYQNRVMILGSIL